jgi:hypothetical protein
VTRLFWNAWHAQYGVAGYNGYAGATANASLWTSTPTTVAALPAADPAPPPQYSQPAAPYVFPVLDRTSADRERRPPRMRRASVLTPEIRAELLRAQRSSVRGPSTC